MRQNHAAGVGELAAPAALNGRDEDRSARHADVACGAQQQATAIGAAGATVVLRRDDDEAGLLVTRRQVAVRERLQITGGGGEMQTLLNLEDELVGGDAVIAATDDDQAVDVAEVLGDLAGLRLEPATFVEMLLECGRVQLLARNMSGDHRAGDHRRDVADGVAPALVLLRRDQHDVGEFGAPALVVSRNQRGGLSSLARGLQGEHRRARAVVV